MNDSTQTLPISGRIPEEDYTYLMEFPLPGKVTASEKLRHVCTFFRLYHENQQTYPECVAELQRLLQPFTRELKETEASLSLQSDLMDKLMNIIPDMLAYMITRRRPEDGKQGKQYLARTEEHLCNSTLMLLESILRMGLTARAPTYNPNIFNGKLETIIELVGLISQKR